MKDQIAIVGIGCRFPGAPDPRAFWKMMCDGVDAIREVPPDRFDIDAYYDPRPGTRGKMMSRRGGFIDDVDRFDAAFFGISPREAARMDPQHRLLLEVAWEAIEDACLVPDSLRGSNASVFIGIITSDYWDRQFHDPMDLDLYSTTGSSRSGAAGRISYALGLGGVSVALDAACSSSLVAVHLACQSLRAGSCDLAIAGGVNLILNPDHMIGFSQSKMMAADGRCKTFDVRADGYGRSEGVGVVVLKPLSRAIADGDTIHAVILGSAANNDGKGDLFMAPSVAGQKAALQMALADAGLPPDAAQYVEAHGTGTSVGDPVEIEAIAGVLGAGRPPERPLLVGSVKTNIGHTEGAAGLAGLIKTAFCLENGVIPPNLHFVTPNPRIPWANIPIRVPTRLTPWPETDGPRVAGVSSFGIAGTNAHVILGEPPRRERLEAHADEGPFLLTLSASDKGALEAMARSVDALLAETPDSPGALRDIAYTACARRAHHEHRAAIVAGSLAEARNGIAALLRGDADAGLSTGRVFDDRGPKLVFVFPGQGSQWLGMARASMQHEPVFRAALEACDRAMRAYVDWSLLEELAADEATSRLGDIDVIQPALWAIQVSLVELLRSFGIRPDAVVGHSMGEVAAAYVAGALSLEDAAQIICRRSQLLRRVRGQGAMLVVDLSIERARTTIRGHEDRVSIAVSNGPTSTVLSGDPQALTGIMSTLEQAGTFCRWVNVDVASHSPQMVPLRDDLLAALADVRPRAGSIPFYSTVLCDPCDGAKLDAAYWVDNLREPVLFSGAVEKLARDGFDTFIEMSPHPILVGAVQQTLKHAGQKGTVLASMRRNEERSALLACLGGSYTRGAKIHWPALFPRGANLARLPRYPWQRERHWNAAAAARPTPSRMAPALHIEGGHPLIGRMVPSALQPDTFSWESLVGPQKLPYMTHHRVQEMVILSASAYVDMALSAAAEAFGADQAVIENFTFVKALFFPEGTAQFIQVVITPEEAGRASLRIFSRAANAPGRAATFELRARATIRHYPTALPSLTATHPSPPRALPHFGERIDVDAFYRGIVDRGIQHGPPYQGIVEIRRRPGEVLAELRVHPEIADDMAGYQLHPALLDACFQALIPFLPYGADTYVPVSIGSARLFRRPQPNERLWSHARAPIPTGLDADEVRGDVFLLDDDGRVLFEALGLSMMLLERGKRAREERELRDLFFALAWKPSERIRRSSPPKRCLILADRRGLGAALAAKLEALGTSCALVAAGESYARLAPGRFSVDPKKPAMFRQLLNDAFAGEPCDCVAYLWSTDTTPPAATTLDSLRDDQQLVTVGALHLIQALHEAGFAKAPRLWLVTRGSQAVLASDEVNALAQSTLWGLGRVAVYEHPQLRCSLLDLDAASDASDALLAEIDSDDPADEVAIRGESRYVARIERHTPATAAAEMRSFRSDATYLVVGGLGGIGLVVAQRMVEQGARHLVLMGRRGATEATQAALSDMRAAGANVVVARADVSQAAQLERVLEDIARTMPPLRGLIHSAVVLDDGILLQQTRERMLSVLPPKLDGSWNLHVLTKNLPLDFFVMFSSGASLFGSPGQGNYAAATAFQDALAHHRRALGLPALTIDWGPWAEVGQATIESRSERLQARGVGAMSTRQGLAALGRVLEEHLAQIAVMSFNPTRWLESFPQLRQSSLFAELVPSEAEARPVSQVRSEQKLLERLGAANPATREPLLKAHLGEQVAAVLGLSASKLDPEQPLSRLGLDSLMAVEIKNRIADQVGVTIPVATFLQGVTIEKLASQIMQQLGL